MHLPTNTEADIQPLRRLNLIAGFLHAVSLTAVLALANGFSLRVTSTYTPDGPGKGFAAPVLLFNISEIAALIAIFGVNVSMILFGWLQEK